MKIRSVGIFDELPKTAKITMSYTTIMQKLLSGEWRIKTESLVKPGMTKSIPPGVTENIQQSRGGKYATREGGDHTVREGGKEDRNTSFLRKQEHVIPAKAGIQGGHSA